MSRLGRKSRCWKSSSFQGLGHSPKCLDLAFCTTNMHLLRFLTWINFQNFHQVVSDQLVCSAAS